jgi:hypothetical protein
MSCLSHPLFTHCVYGPHFISVLCSTWILWILSELQRYETLLTEAADPKTIKLLRHFHFGLKSHQWSGCKHYVGPGLESAWRNMIYYHTYFIFITGNAVIYHQPFYVSNIHPTNMEKDWIEGVRSNYIGGANDLLSVKPFTCQIRAHP